MSTSDRLHISVLPGEETLLLLLEAIGRPGATLTLDIHRMELTVGVVSVLMRRRCMVMVMIHRRVVVLTVLVREGLRLAALAAEVVLLVVRRRRPTARLVMIWQHACCGLSRCWVRGLVEFLIKVCTLLIILRHP